jgi:hypothetical protein
VTRLVDLDHALDHTSQSQFDGWDLNNAKIIDLYINSALGRCDTLEGHAYEADDMWRKVVAYNSDHAADVVSAAYKSKDRKIGVIEKDLGRKRLEGMSMAEAEATLWDVVRETCDDPDSLDPKYVFRASFVY